MISLNSKAEVSSNGPSRSYVLAYKNNGSVEGVPIPVGYEDRVDAEISKKRGVKIKKYDLDLKHEDILGIFTLEEFEGLKVIGQPARPGYESFLAMGKKLKEKAQMERLHARQKRT